MELNFSPQNDLSTKELIDEWLSRQHIAQNGNRWKSYNKEFWSDDCPNYFSVDAVEHRISPQQLFIAGTSIEISDTKTQTLSTNWWVLRLILRAGGTYIAVCYNPQRIGTPQTQTVFDVQLPLKDKAVSIVRKLTFEEQRAVADDYKDWKSRYVTYCLSLKRQRGQKIGVTRCVEQEDEAYDTSDEDEIQIPSPKKTQVTPPTTALPPPEDFAKRYLQLLSQKSMLTTQLLQLEIDLVRLLEEQKQYFNNL